MTKGGEGGARRDRQLGFFLLSGHMLREAERIDGYLGADTFIWQQVHSTVQSKAPYLKVLREIEAHR